MQYRPTADELLTAMADVLDNAIVPALPPDVQHRARVCANLARILEREARLGPAAAAREDAMLTELLGHGGDLVDLRAELTDRLRTSDDDQFDRAAWEVLVAVTRDDLSISKPGHDAWEGE